MYQAITTKYLGPTNVRGSRVKARAAAGSITLEWNDALNSEQNHAVAAMALCQKLDWRGDGYRFHAGVTANGENVFVCESDTFFTPDYDPTS